MNPSSPVLQPKASPADVALPKIAFAVSAADRAVFFGEFPADLSEIADCRWAEDEELAKGGGWRKVLQAWRPEVLVTGWRTPPLPAEWIDSPDCPLRYVCHVAGSVRRLVPRRFLERGGLVSNWGPLVSPQVAEHALLLALAALRDLPRWRDNMNPSAPERTSRLRTRTLFGRRVGIHGCGGVARALVPLLRPFGVEIACFSAGVPPEVLRAAGMSPARSLAALFAESEVLFECEALTPANERSVNAALLAKLPDDAVVVNVGRGRLIDEPALQREAASGRLRVALDVMEQEPPPPHSPWWKTTDAILSPHVGGPTFDLFPRCGSQALSNLRRFLAGEDIENQVTPELYDRAT